MRSSKSRNRSKSNRNGRQFVNVVNRVFDSSGPDGKVRGTPQQIIDKYQLLERDSQLAGDRIAAENFLQHAEHYMRLLTEAQKEVEARREAQERENRERQAVRESERTAHKATNDQVAGASESDAPQSGLAAPSSLVETPESHGAPPQRSKGERPKRASKKDASAASEPQDNISDALAVQD